jgi:hypothetical protein
LGLILLVPCPGSPSRPRAILVLLCTCLSLAGWRRQDALVVAAEATPPPPPPPPPAAAVVLCTSLRGTLVVCYAPVWWRRGVACQGCLSAAWVGYCAYWACTCVFDGPQCTGGAAKQENEKQGNQNSLRDLLPSMWLVMCKRPKETGMHIKRSAILAPPLSAGEGGGVNSGFQLG